MDDDVKLMISSFDDMFITVGSHLVRLEDRLLALEIEVSKLMGVNE